jgi:DNA polymerase III delta prime subunit
MIDIARSEGITIDHTHLTAFAEFAQKKLARAESVIQFYAEKGNWDDSEEYEHCMIANDDIDENDQYFGGKRAREYFKEKK